MSAAEYLARARQHQPADPAALAQEMRRLAAGGLLPLDISEALRVALGQVLEALQGRQVAS